MTSAATNPTPIRQAVILAGGLGTRFRAVREDIPKPLAPIAGRPVLEHQIEALRPAGVQRVVLCVGHQSAQIMDHFGDGTAMGVEIRYALERELLGTGGAILNARALLRDDAFFALNGDSLLCGLDFAAVAAFHRGRTGADAATVGTLVVVRPPDAGAYGVLDVEPADDRIARFREKAPVHPEQSLISGGVYVLEPGLFRYIPAGRPVSIEYEVFPGALADARSLWAFRHDGFFGDIGTPAGYAQVERHLQSSSVSEGVQR